MLTSIGWSVGGGWYEGCVGSTESDLERLAVATVVRPEPTDPIVTMRTTARQPSGSDHVRILTQAFSAMVIDVMSERVLADERTVDVVAEGTGNGNVIRNLTTVSGPTLGGVGI